MSDHIKKRKGKLFKRKMNEQEREAQQRHNIPLADAKRDYIARGGENTVKEVRTGMHRVFGPSRIEKELAAREGISVEEFDRRYGGECKHSCVDDTVRVMAMNAVDNVANSVLKLQAKREPITSVLDYAKKK